MDNREKTLTIFRGALVEEIGHNLRSNWRNKKQRTVNGQCFMSAWTVASVNFLPIKRLASKIVLEGFMATWFLAASPMRRSVSVKATYEGVVLLP